jgi:hypothetical protein
MKYIIATDGMLEYPVIFPNCVPHAVVARNTKVVAAGEVSFNVNSNNEIEASCFGQSLGLRVKTRGSEDEVLIEQALEKF